MLDTNTEFVPLEGYVGDWNADENEIRRIWLNWYDNEFLQWPPRVQRAWVEMPEYRRACRFVRRQKRFKSQCYSCGKHVEDPDSLQVHHIKNKRHHPGLIGDIRNLVPVCEVCHEWMSSTFVETRRNIRRKK